MEDFEILFVDDDRDILELVEKYLSRYGYNIRVVDNATEALDLVLAGNYGIVFTDYKMPDVDGLELLSNIKEYKPETVVIVVTGHGTMESAIKAMRYGSYDYIQKPFKLDVLKLLVDRVFEEKKLANEAVLLRSRVTPRHKYDALIGMNLKMQEIYETIDRIKGNSPGVLIQGETGTGKELVARVIHKTGDRPQSPFISVKCSGFVKEHPDKNRMDRLAGLFKSAGNGTLFLDEFGDIPPELQRAMLQFVQTGKIARGEDGGEVAAEARVMVSSSRDLLEDSAGGQMDAGLIKHLSAVSIKMPPLRERKEDICPLMIHFLDRFNAKNEKKIGGISAGAMDVLLAYHWPGNVIELENVIERAFATGVETIIQLGDLPPDIRTFGEISGMV